MADGRDYIRSKLGGATENKNQTLRWNSAEISQCVMIFSVLEHTENKKRSSGQLSGVFVTWIVCETPGLVRLIPIHSPSGGGAGTRAFPSMHRAEDREALKAGRRSYQTLDVDGQTVTLRGNLGSRTPCVTQPTHPNLFNYLTTEPLRRPVITLTPRLPASPFLYLPLFFSFFLSLLPSKSVRLGTIPRACVTSPADCGSQLSAVLIIFLLASC